MDQESIDQSIRADQKYCAWEDRRQIGSFKALWQTWRDSVFYPEKFFGNIPIKGSIGPPVLYALIISWVAIIVNQLYNIIFYHSLHGIIVRFFEPYGPIPILGTPTWIPIIIMASAPVLIISALFISTAIYHLLFLIFGWSKNEFESTFRAVAYSVGPIIFWIVPFCGGITACIWMAVLLIIGLKDMQQTTNGRAAAVYFLPVILCCCLITIIFMALVMFYLGTVAFSSLGGLIHN